MTGVRVANLDNPKSKKFPCVVSPRLQITRKAPALSRQRKNPQHPLSSSVVQGQCCSRTDCTLQSDIDGVDHNFTRKRQLPYFHAAEPQTVLPDYCWHSANIPLENGNRFRQQNTLDTTQNCSPLTASTATFIKAHLTIKNLEFFAAWLRQNRVWRWLQVKVNETKWIIIKEK